MSIKQNCCNKGNQHKIKLSKCNNDRPQMVSGGKHKHSFGSEKGAGCDRSRLEDFLRVCHHKDLEDIRKVRRCTQLLLYTSTKVTGEQDEASVQTCITVVLFVYSIVETYTWQAQTWHKNPSGICGLHSSASSEFETVCMKHIRHSYYPRARMFKSC